MKNLIAIKTFCRSHDIDPDFVYSIYENGLIEIVQEEDDEFIEETQLTVLEKSVRLHRDLHLRSDGIATVFELLDQMDTLQKEVVRLKNKLALYEGQ